MRVQVDRVDGLEGCTQYYVERNPFNTASLVACDVVLSTKNKERNNCGSRSQKHQLAAVCKIIPTLILQNVDGSSWPWTNAMYCKIAVCNWQKMEKHYEGAGFVENGAHLELVYIWTNRFVNTLSPSIYYPNVHKCSTNILKTSTLKISNTPPTPRLQHASTVVNVTLSRS